MEWPAAIALLRQAAGKGPEAALAASVRIMEYAPDRSCGYAELRSACARASSAREPAAAWVAAQEQAEAAKLQLARFAKPPQADCPCAGSSTCLFCSLPVTDPDTTLEYFLAAVDRGYRGRFPWTPLVRWYLDTQPRRIHERAATVSTTAGEVDMTRRPRLASQALTGRWEASVHAGEVDGVLVAARTQVPRTELQVCHPAPPPKASSPGQFPLPPRDERLTMIAAFDRRNPVLRGDTSLLLDVAHMADFPVRGRVREWAALLARSRDGGFRHPQACDFRRVWDAALAARCMLLRERDAAGKQTGRWAPLAHVDADWNATRPADPDRDELVVGPSQWLREAMRSTGGWTLTAAGGERGRSRVTVGEQSMAGLLVTALEYCLAGYYDGGGRTGRYLLPPRPGGPGPVASLPWRVVMYLVGDPAEFATDGQRNAAWMRFNRAVARLKERGYFLPPDTPNASAPAGDSVEIVTCTGRPARIQFRAADWFCAAAKQVAERPDGFTQVPLGDYLRRSKWRIAPAHTDGDPRA